MIDALDSFRDDKFGVHNGKVSAADILQEAALKGATALWAMSVNAAPGSLERSARLQQERRFIFICILNFQSSALQSGSLRRISQLHLRKERPIAAKAAFRAEDVREAWLHKPTVAWLRITVTNSSVPIE